MTKTYMKQDYRDSAYNCALFGGPDLAIGKEFDFGMVIAFGWYNSPDEGQDQYHSVMMLVPDCKRRIGWNQHSNANYAVGFLNNRTGSFENVTFYANIVEASNAYVEDYGMEI